MFCKVFWEIIYILTIVFLNTNIFENITSNTITLNIIFKIVNCFSLYKYINNLMKLLNRLNDINIDNQFILKIIYMIFNSIIILVIIGYTTYQTVNCYNIKCLDKFDFIGIFNIIISIILLAQLISHLIFPFHNCSLISDNINIDTNNDTNNEILFKKIKYILLIVTMSLCYNLFVPIITPLPNNIYVIIYHVYIVLCVILSFRFLFFSKIKSFYDYLLLVMGIIILITIICINIFLLITYNEYTYIQIIVNFLFLVIITILIVYILIINKRNNMNNNINNDTDLEYVVAN